MLVHAASWMVHHRPPVARAHAGIRSSVSAPHVVHRLAPAVGPSRMPPGAVRGRIIEAVGIARVAALWWGIDRARRRVMDLPR
ncbi:MAG: hypothetical protein C0494_07960 [Sphingobium sp.]|uniref:Uncharacterized protein n=1 Tax=Sphingomonas bisphenolicum TaxID=296544 RepID=A0ABN5WFV8_9SPHN|nr:hypothetical protein [Sphingomonas bisphenolicum]MBA4090509.1 hypothetical protein [Sphingobium sp.]BBF71189.1 hypothetical protein SBA_ch1_33890 [Sphingomonas bisphenolicum]